MQLHGWSMKKKGFGPLTMAKLPKVVYIAIKIKNWRLTFSSSVGSSLKPWMVVLAWIGFHDTTPSTSANDASVENWWTILAIDRGREGKIWPLDYACSCEILERVKCTGLPAASCKRHLYYHCQDQRGGTGSEFGRG
jgi:hypothetical protein